jgi:zinc transporter ZupT
MELNWWKLLFTIAIWVVCVGFTLLPLALRGWRPHTQQRVLSIANAFAGGVFLAGGLVHMLTDALEELEGTDFLHGFPLIQVLMGAGFMLVFFIEKVRSCSSCSRSSGRSSCCCRSCSSWWWWWWWWWW